MPSRPNHARSDSPPPSRVKGSLPTRAPVQSHNPRSPVPPRTPPQTFPIPANLAPPAKTQRVRAPSRKAPHSTARTKDLFPTSGPPQPHITGFDTPDVPAKAPAKSRLATSQPIRNAPVPPYANTLSACKRNPTKKGPSKMNPMAVSFQPPKPTYAQTVKATMSSRSVSEGKVASTTSTGEVAAPQGASRNKQNGPSKQHTNNTHHAHPPVQGKIAKNGESSRGSSVPREHRSTPSIQVTRPDGAPQTGNQMYPHPPVHRGNSGQARHTPDWHNRFHSPMPFPNPLVGAYTPVPYPHGAPFPQHGYYGAHFQPGSPMAWDPAAAAIWGDYHGSPSAQAMYGPFPPPPVPPHDIQHLAPMPYYGPYMAPFTSYQWQSAFSGPSIPGSYHGGPVPGQQQPNLADRTLSRDSAKWRAATLSAHGIPYTPNALVWKAPQAPHTAQGSKIPKVPPAPQTPVAPREAARRETTARPLATPASENKLQLQQKEAASAEQQTPGKQQGSARYRLISTKHKVGLGESVGRGGKASRSRRTVSASSHATHPDDEVVSPKCGHPIQPMPEEYRRAVVLSEQSPTPNTKPVKADRPPANAPTGPASLRRYANLQQLRTSLIQRPAEQGSWSQSKRWVSQETKERNAFQKLMHNLHYMRADKSPVIPKTPAALTQFRLAQAERKSKKMADLLRVMQERRLRRAKLQEEGIGGEDKLELFGGKKMKETLSPVFAQDTCFNEGFSPERLALLADWPCRGELKEEGDRRAARYGRYFPLPRLNLVATRIMNEETEPPFNDDGTISWQKKAIKHASRFIRPVTSEHEPPIFTEPILFNMEELHAPIRDLLREIDYHGRDGEDRKGKKAVGK